MLPMTEAIGARSLMPKKAAPAAPIASPPPNVPVMSPKPSAPLSKTAMAYSGISGKHGESEEVRRQ